MREDKKLIIVGRGHVGKTIMAKEPERGITINDCSNSVSKIINYYSEGLKATATYSVPYVDSKNSSQKKFRKVDKRFTKPKKRRK